MYNDDQSRTSWYMRDVLLKPDSGALSSVMSFASSVIVARALGVEGNGLAALLILIPTMIGSVGSLGIDKANVYTGLCNESCFDHRFLRECNWP